MKKCANFLLSDEEALCLCSILNFLIYEENFLFFFYQWGYFKIIIYDKKFNATKRPIYVWIDRHQSQFPHSCVFERFIYSQDRSTFFSCSSRIGRPIVGIYKRSQTHECWNWDLGCTIPFLGIFVSNFQYFVFAVWASNALRGLLNMNAKKELTFCVWSVHFLCWAIIVRIFFCFCFLRLWYRVRRAGIF